MESGPRRLMDAIAVKINWGVLAVKTLRILQSRVSKGALLGAPSSEPMLIPTEPRASRSYPILRNRVNGYEKWVRAGYGADTRVRGHGYAIDPKEEQFSYPPPPQTNKNILSFPRYPLPAQK